MNTDEILNNESEEKNGGVAVNAGLRTTQATKYDVDNLADQLLKEKVIKHKYELLTHLLDNYKTSQVLESELFSEEIGLFNKLTDRLEHTFAAAINKSKVHLDDVEFQKNRQIETLELKVAEQKETFSKHKETEETLTRKIEQQSKQILDLQKDVDSKDEALQTKTNEYGILKRLIDDYQQEKENFKVREEEFKATTSQLKEEISSKDEKIDQLQNDQKTIIKKHDEKIEQLQNNQKTLIEKHDEKLELQRQRYEEKLEALRVEHSQKIEQLHIEHTQKIDVLRDKLDKQHRNESTELNKENRRLNTDNVRLQASLENLNSEIERLKSTELESKNKKKDD